MSNKNTPEGGNIVCNPGSDVKVDDRQDVVGGIGRGVSSRVRARRPYATRDWCKIRPIKFSDATFDYHKIRPIDPALGRLAEVLSGIEKGEVMIIGLSERMQRGFFLAKTIRVEKLNQEDRKNFEAMMKLMQEYYEDETLFAIDDGGKGELLGIVVMNGMALESLQRFIDPKLLSDRDVILAAVKNAGQALQFAAPQLHADPEIIHVAVQNDGSMLCYASPELRGNKEFVIMAVKNTDKALEFASPELREDREVLLAARKIGMHLPRANKCVARALENDKEIVLASINSELSYHHAYVGAYNKVIGSGGHAGDVYELFSFKLTFPHYVSTELMHDEDVLLAAMSVYGGLFDSIPKKMKNNKKIALAAVSNFGPALAILPDAFRSDKDIVLAAVAQSGEALEFASDDMKADKDVVLTVTVRRGDLELQDLSENFKDNKAVVLAAVTQNGWALQYASDRLKDDEEVVLRALEYVGDMNGDIFQYASIRLRAQKHIVLKALSRRLGKGAFEYITSESIKQDQEVIDAFERAHTYCGDEDYDSEL